MEKIKRIFLLLWIIFCFSACGEKPDGLNKAQLMFKADSIFHSEVPALKRQAQEDLKNRLPIELKPKIDSLLNIHHEIPPVPQLENSEADSLSVPAALQPTVSSRPGLRKAPSLFESSQVPPTEKNDTLSHKP